MRIGGQGGKEGLGHPGQVVEFCFLLLALVLFYSLPTTTDRHSLHLRRPPFNDIVHGHIEQSTPRSRHNLVWEYRYASKLYLADRCSVSRYIQTIHSPAPPVPAPPPRVSRLNPPIEFHLPVPASSVPKVLLQRPRLHLLPLGERSQRQGQGEYRGCENQPYVPAVSHAFQFLLAGFPLPLSTLAFPWHGSSFPPCLQRLRNIPRLMGNTSLGRCFNHSVRCNRTRIRGGKIIFGVAFSTRDSAVSPTANVAAFLLFPNLFTSPPSRSLCSFSSSVKTG